MGRTSISIANVLRLLEEALPLQLQESWDNSGLQVGDPRQICRGALLCLDVTETVIEEALRRGCNLIIAHHPLLFHPLRRIGVEHVAERCVAMVIRHNIVVYAAHTNADSAPRGLNWLLAQRLGLRQPQILEPHASEVGAGLGYWGILPEAIPFDAFLGQVAELFDSKQVHHSSYIPKSINRAAVCGGAGAYLTERARGLGIEVMITGEAKHHDYIDAQGICLVTVGHHESEWPITTLFQQIIESKYPKICQIAETNTNPIICKH